LGKSKIITMTSIRIENLHQIDNSHGLSEGEIEKEFSLVKTFLENIEQREQGFYSVIDDEDLLNKIESFATNANGKYEHIVLLGIGGSALGSICLQQTFAHLFQERKPKLIILDNIDPLLIQEAAETINPSSTLFIVVTKSGSTPETLAQFFFFKDLCLASGMEEEEAASHFVIITDPEKGFLRALSREENYITFDIPENVGGRFSVLTAVGLLPAALIGIDIKKIIEGANQMRESFLKINHENQPFLLATIQYLLYKKGKSINVLMPYAQKLNKFSEWYKQLLAESVGKKYNNHGEEIYAGITPVNALGVTDQHSQSQLYNEGPNDKLIIILNVKQLSEEIKIPVKVDHEAVNYLHGVTFNELIETEMTGTINALTQNNRPNITIEIEKIDENALGQLFMLFEAATAFLGEFMEINAFDQPGVELSKQITKQLLLQQHGNNINGIVSS
jgi:glucose-6-phosphate isomerase